MESTKIAIFDMDHTVIDTDCDVSWKYFLADRGLAPGGHRQEADRFFELYHQGKTPVAEFIEFQLSEFVSRTEAEMRTIAEDHFVSRIQKLVYTEAKRMIDWYSNEGVHTAMLTGTNRIIAEPVANYLGIHSLMATEPELINGRFTGRIEGDFLMKEAKLDSATQLSLSHNISFNMISYHADSITDVALLEKVGTPIVINPGPALKSHAEAQNWQVKNWHLNKKSAVGGV